MSREVTDLKTLVSLWSYAQHPWLAQNQHKDVVRWSVVYFGLLSDGVLSISSNIQNGQIVAIGDGLGSSHSSSFEDARASTERETRETRKGSNVLLEQAEATEAAHMVAADLNIADISNHIRPCTPCLSHRRASRSIGISKRPKVTPTLFFPPKILAQHTQAKERGPILRTKIAHNKFRKKHSMGPLKPQAKETPCSNLTFTSCFVADLMTCNIAFIE